MRELILEGRIECKQHRHDSDFYSSVILLDSRLNRIYFLRDVQGNFEEYKTHHSDWYITVAIEKLSKITTGRHRINSALVIEYRNAVREGYNHQLDTNLRNPYDYPRNKNTVEGVIAYIARIQARQLVYNLTPTDEPADTTTGQL